MDQSKEKYDFILFSCFLSRSYANKTMYVRCDCNRRIHRAHFKFVEYQHNKMPVGLDFVFFSLIRKKVTILHVGLLLNSSLLLSKCLWRYFIFHFNKYFKFFF